MIHVQHPAVAERLFDGLFGLERETLRVTDEGYMAHTLHPFDGDPNIVKDFCENQTEINTGVHQTAQGVIAELQAHTERLYAALRERGEWLWMFSNPPYLRDADDIPVARFEGENKGKQNYRLYLAEKYGKYKMTFSGIHVNYSFDEGLLREDFALSSFRDFTEYKNHVYLSLAQGYLAYGWLLNLLLAASPLCDGSYCDPAKIGQDFVTGDASVRCSYHGYWNRFTPVLRYDDILSYAESIQQYIVNGILQSAGELYYPVRLKPRGNNRLNTLVQNGVNHIELRNVDIDPFAPAGLDERDLGFIELLILWLSAEKEIRLSRQEQFFAIENFKCAARYDIDRESVRLPSGGTASVREAGISVLREMTVFYRSVRIGEEQRRKALDLIAYQLHKLTEPGARYADRVLEEFSGGFVKKGMAYIRAQREEERSAVTV